MKKQFLKMTLWMALITLTLSATAGARDFERYTVKLDFDFMVGEQRMPAGEYSFQVFEGDNSRRMVLVLNQATNQHALYQAIPVTRPDANSAPLVFNKYGDQHYVSRISLGDYAYEAIKASSERKLARQ
jgi:hypothetical protein